MQTLTAPSIFIDFNKDYLKTVCAKPVFEKKVRNSHVERAGL